ncbi:MAG: aldo/keto reductase [Alkaliphilus sp.]|nr:MAG: aldo/keto reductase [Alkaliphilus sp.]
MDKSTLGNTSLSVSRLCFGSLTIGPLQANLSPEDGAMILTYAFERGVNFVDTAELYGTYPHVKNALKNVNRQDIVIASKSYAYSKKTAEQSLKKALTEMDLEYIDIFLLHEQESEHTLRGHFEALEYLVKMKEKGYIKAVGLSTHYIASVKASLKYKEIDIIHPIVNMLGLGIQDGSVNDMLRELKKAQDMGKGIYAMKPFGGGNLLNSFEDCFAFVLSLSYIHSIAIGMRTIEEVQMNIDIFQGKTELKGIQNKINISGKKLNIAYWCDRCGKCVEVCGFKALAIKKNKIYIDHEKCTLCGYCSKYCSQFCIKIV